MGACSEAGRLLGFFVGTARSGAGASQDKKNQKQIRGMYVCLETFWYVSSYVLNGLEVYKPGPRF